jgi:hypothetical protein
MDVHPWQLLVGGAVLLIAYAISVVALDIPVSVSGFLVMVLFVGIGAVVGRFLSRYLS